MNARVERQGIARDGGGRLPSACELEALLAGRLGEEERMLLLERVLADPAGPALLRLACALEPEAERLARDVARASASRSRRPALAWFAPLAAAALLALLVLPGSVERTVPADPMLAGGEAAILLADFEALPGESETGIFASQFDG